MAMVSSTDFLCDVRKDDCDWNIDRPLPVVASDRDPQAVHFVKPNALHRTGLSIGQDHGLADKLSLGLLELAEDRGRTDFRSWHE
jgi:hypothetical protein